MLYEYHFYISGENVLERRSSSIIESQREKKLKKS